MGFAWGVWPVVCECVCVFAEGEVTGCARVGFGVVASVRARVCLWVELVGLGMERALVQAFATWGLRTNVRTLRLLWLAIARRASDRAWVGWRAQGASICSTWVAHDFEWA